MFEDEEWRPVKEFPHYLVSSYGRVRHIDSGIPREIKANERGFPVILLSSASSPTRYMRQVNKLVAEAFLPTPEYSDETAIWHKDGDLLNCHADNLKWERRGRVLEWNDMHRRNEPRWPSPRVKNRKTGKIYANAYECAMDDGVLESSINWEIEKYMGTLYEDRATYRWVGRNE